MRVRRAVHSIWRSVRPTTYVTAGQQEDAHVSQEENRAAYRFRQHQELGFTDWCAGARESFGDLRITCDDPENFSASVRTASLGDVELFDMTTPAHSVARTPDAHDVEHNGYCKLSLQLDGEAVLTQDGRTCHLRPGDLALYVTKRPYQLEYPGQQRSLIVLFPQNFVHLGADYVGVITATPVSDQQGLGKFAVPLFEQLAANLDELSGPHALALVRSALEMLITVMAAESNEAGRSPGNMLFHQAVAYIEEHLGDPDLGPGKIADALYISLRQLHGRFAANQQTVSTYIRTRRLECIREDLANPLYRGDSVQTISARYALFDPSHVSKAFKAECGESPSAYRARMLAS